jgi:DHA1 family bicyclomycin/chloramphenicol resistance-like MFS transporter
VTTVALPSTLSGRVRFVLILGALSAMGPLSIDFYLPGLPALSDDLDASASQAQLTLTACLAGLAVGQLLAGPLSDRLGRRRPLLIGLFGYTAASLACALSPTIYALVVLRLVQGFAGAGAIVIARAIVRDLRSGAAAARLYSILMLVTGLAPMLAPILGGQLLRVMSWRGLFVGLAIAGVCLLLGSVSWLAETLPPGLRHPGSWRGTASTFSRLVHDRVFVGFALVLGLAFAQMFAYIAGSPFVIEDVYGVSPQLFAVAFGVNALGIVACSQLNGLLVNRVGPTRMLEAGLTVGAIGGVTLLAVSVGGIGLAGILPCLFVIVSSIGLVLPNATALALSGYDPQVAGSASALLGVLQFAFGAAVAPLVGAVGVDSAVPMAVVMATLGLSAFGAFLLTRHPAHALP